MNKDKKVLYAISFIIFGLLLSAFFIGWGDSKVVAACLVLLLAPLTCVLVRKRSALSINKKEVLLLMSVLAIIYVVLVQMSSLLFGSYHNPYTVDLKFALTTVIPLAIIIVGIEIIRFVLLTQRNKIVSVITFLSCVLAEMLMFACLEDIVNFNFFMDMVGMTLFPALSANVLYHYISRNFGFMPNVVFRLITTLYIYFFDTLTDMGNALLSCIKIILPLVILAFISTLFAKKKKNARRGSEKLSTAGMVVAIMIVVSVAMLISCRFRYGVIVIATESMTGEINKGDIIIYEEYSDQKIEVGQVIVFREDQNRVIHRVVKIEKTGTETRYYTKGDANEDNDHGYRTKADLVGLTDFKIAYAGYPTLWLHELINSAN